MRPAPPALLAVLTVTLLTVVVGPSPGGVPSETGHSSASPSEVPRLSPGASHLGPVATDPRVAANGEGRLSVNTTDPGVVPNDGIRVNLTAFASTIVNPQTSFQAGVSETIGGFDAVFGIFENSEFPPVAFFSVFSNQTNANVRLVYWSNLTLVTGSSYDFALTHTVGTVWNLTVNGAAFGGNATAGSFDFGAVQATWSGGISFSEVALFAGQTTVPPVLTVPLAIAVHRTDGWYLPQSGATAFVGLGSPPWGVEGRLQHPTLAPGELDTGVSVPSEPNGTLLWMGGRAPVRVGLTVPSLTTVGTEATLVTLEVTDLTGAPIPGVALFLNDSLHGSYTSPALITNGTGGAETVFATPNVTTTSTDLVQASVTSLGYVGSAGIGMTLTPPSEVVVTLASGTTSVTPGGTLPLEFATHDPTGAVLSGIFLSFSVVVGAASFSPEFGTTDASGDFSVVLTAPPAESTVTIEATVATGGSWGHRTLDITVQNAQPTFWGRYGSTIEGIGLVAALGLVVAVVWMGRRRRRKALPAMPIRQYWREVRAGTSPSGDRPISRTPP